MKISHIPHGILGSETISSSQPHISQKKKTNQVDWLIYRTFENVISINLAGIYALNVNNSTVLKYLWY